MGKPRFKAGRWKPLMDLQGYELVAMPIRGFCVNCRDFALITAKRNGMDAICEECQICNNLNWNKNGTKVLPGGRPFEFKRKGWVFE